MPVILVEGILIFAEERLRELEDANEANGPIFKMKDDPRITRVGKMIRRLLASRSVDPLVGAFIRYVLSREGQEVVVKDGYLPIPDRPGLGISLDLDFIERHRK